MVVAERAASKQSAADSAEPNDTTETYSTNVPGQAGDDRLQLVRRASTVQRISANAVRTTTTRVEQPNPGDPSAGLHLTQETIDIVRPAANGTVTHTSTILTSNSNGHLDAVWVDIGTTNNPAIVKVDVAAPK